MSEESKPAWMSQLSADLQTSEPLTRFPTLSDLGKAYLEAEGKLQKAIFIPAEGATEQEFGDFFGKLGRPAKPEEYAVERPKLPDGMQYDEAMEKEFRAAAHKAGVSNRQFKALYDLFNSRQIAAYQSAAEQSAKALQASQDALKKEWGNDYDTKTELAKRALIFMGGQELIDEVNRTGIGNSPSLVKVFAEVGRRLSDDKLVFGGKKEESVKATGQFVYENSPGMYSKTK